MQKKYSITISIVVVCITFLFLFHPPVFFSKTTYRSTPADIQNETAPVLYVIDGDSFAISLKGDRREVRLIGIDAPELYGKDGKAECFATQSAAFLKTMLTDRTVHMMSDPTQEDQDIYGRLLRYVTLSDGTLVNESLIKEGYAREYTYRVPYTYQSRFQQTEAAAHIQKKGLWANNACRTN